MNAIDKLQLMFRQAGIDVVPAGLHLGFTLGLLAWLIRTLSSSNAALWASSFGDNSPLAFDRREEPREYWALVVLAFVGCACGLWMAIDKLFHFTNTAP